VRAADVLAKVYYSMWWKDTANDELKKNALTWARRAAEMGSIADTGYFLAVLAPDNSEAIKWVTISAQVGHID